MRELVIAPEVAHSINPGLNYIFYSMEIISKKCLIKYGW